MGILFDQPAERVVLAAVAALAVLIAGAFAIAFATVPGRLSSIVAAAAFLVLVAAGLYAWRGRAPGPAA